MKTIVRTNQLGSEFLQTFTNKSGLSPIFNMILDGYSFSGDRIFDGIIDKSSFPNATPPNFGNNNPNAQSLWRVINRDDTGNRYIQWFDLDKSAVPGNNFIVGTYIRTLNDVSIPVGIAFEVVPTTNTTIPIGFRYQELGKTTSARPFQAFDNIALTSSYLTPSVDWIGYFANFRSANGTGFVAVNRGTGSGTSSGSSQGFRALVQTDINDGTVDEEKFGFVARLQRTDNPGSSAILIGYRCQVDDTTGSTTRATKGYEFGVFGTNKVIVGGSFGFRATGNGIVQNFEGFRFEEDAFTSPMNNKGFVASMISGSDTGTRHFLGHILNPKSRVFTAVVGSNLTGDLTQGVRGFVFADNGFTFSSLGFSSAFEAVLSGVYNTNFHGVHTSCTGTIGAGVVVRGWLNDLDGAVVNGDFVAILANLLPTSVSPSSNIISRNTVINNAATMGNLFNVDRVEVSGNIISSPVIISYHNGKLGTATLDNPFNSFTQRYQVSNFDTGLGSEVVHNWDLRAIGVSSSAPVNSRFAIFGQGSEKFNIQMNGDVQVVSGNLIVSSGIIQMNNNIVFSSNTGPVLVSPNGTKFKIIVDDTGVLSTISVP